jgi:hypothetical protein
LNLSISEPMCMVVAKNWKKIYYLCHRQCESNICSDWEWSDQCKRDSKFVCQYTWNHRYLERCMIKIGQKMFRNKEAIVQVKTKFLTGYAKKLKSFITDRYQEFHKRLVCCLPGISSCLTKSNILKKSRDTKEKKIQKKFIPLEWLVQHWIP